jgi:hypothetical protein
MLIIGSTSAVGRNHCGAKRAIGLAAATKRRAISWFAQTTPNILGEATSKFFDGFDFKRKGAQGVVRDKLRLETKTAKGNSTKPPPIALSRLKDFVD